jgi:hypothetical protein
MASPALVPWEILSEMGSAGTRPDDRERLNADILVSTPAWRARTRWGRMVRVLQYSVWPRNFSEYPEGCVSSCHQRHPQLLLINRSKS